MANDDGGWNPLSRNPSGFMSDTFGLGNGLSYHETINVNPGGDITKSHTKFSVDNQMLKIYPDGNTSLKKY